MTNGDDTLAEFTRRIEAARAKKAEISAKRDARLAVLKVQDEAFREEREAKELEILDALESEHGQNRKDIYRQQTAEGMVVVKKPNHVLFRKFRAECSKSGSSMPSDENMMKLVRPHLLYPDRETFDRWIESSPHALVEACNAVAFLAGVRKEEVEGE